MYSRDESKSSYSVPGKLLTHEQIKSNVIDIVKIHQKSSPTLFNGKVFENALKNFFKNLKFLREAVHGENEQHVYEGEDGHFHLYRGTNINESLHRRLNTIFPEKCGLELSDSVLKAFVFQWNMKRLLYQQSNDNISTSSSLTIIDVKRINKANSIGLIDLIEALSLFKGCTYIYIYIYIHI